MGHGGNTVTRIPEASAGVDKLDLLVVADPVPTTWAIMGNRKENTYLLPVATSYEVAGSRTASNRSIQWGEQIVKPIFESKDDNEIMYRLAVKLGFADKMFKNIKVENNVPVAEDLLREINRGGWSTGYCGQSPERLKLHMANQKDFDLVTLRASDGPCKGDYYGLPWPCWGTPELKHPGTHTLYNTNLHVMDGGGTFRARFGVERVVKTKAMVDGKEVEQEVRHNLLAEGSYSLGSEIQDGYPEFTYGVLKKLGWDTDLTDAERATIERIGGANPDAVSWAIDLSGGIQRVAMKHGCMHYGNGKARANAFGLPDAIPVHREPIYTPRPDLVAKYPTLPNARQFRMPNVGFDVQKAAVERGIAKEFPLILTLGTPRRVRGRRRGDARQQVAGRAAAGHVHRDQSCGRSRARHQGRRVGLGARCGRHQAARAHEGAGDGAGRQGRDVVALPLRRLVPGRGSALQVSKGRRPGGARRKRQHHHHLRLRSR